MKHALLLLAIGAAVFTLCKPKQWPRRYRIELWPHADEIRAGQLEAALRGENW